MMSDVDEQGVKWAYYLKEDSVEPQVLKLTLWDNLVRADPHNMGSASSPFYDRVSNAPVDASVLKPDDKYFAENAYLVGYTVWLNIRYDYTHEQEQKELTRKIHAVESEMTQLEAKIKKAKQTNSATALTNYIDKMKSAIRKKENLKKQLTVGPPPDAEFMHAMRASPKSPHVRHLKDLFPSIYDKSAHAKLITNYRDHIIRILQLSSHMRLTKHEDTHGMQLEHMSNMSGPKRRGSPGSPGTIHVLGRDRNVVKDGSRPASPGFITLSIAEAHAIENQLKRVL